MNSSFTAMRMAWKLRVAGWLWPEGVPLLAGVGTFPLLGAAWVMAFGLLSRRFERQADVFAASAAGEQAREPHRLSAQGVDMFSSALMEVARLNAISPDRRNFRHGSIRRRVRYLYGLLARGAGAGGVDRGIAMVKAGIWALFALGIALAAGRHLTTL